MKKVLSLVALLGALASTATAAPYYLPAPAGGALTPYDWQPVYSIEGVYNFIHKDLPDTAGARFSFSLYNDASSSVRHQFSINLGYECGSESYPEYFTTTKVDMARIPLTLGYDLNIGLTDNIFLDLGAKAGYAWGDIEVSEKSFDMQESASSHPGGFTFSLGAGVKVQCSDVIYVKVGYEFSRTFYKKCYDERANFGQHSIVLGVGCTF